MDIGFDRESWKNDPAGGTSGKAGSPEWHGLLARLSAARAAQRVIAEQGGLLGSTQVGSFDCISARALADYDQAQASVNPVPWSDGKSPRKIDAVVAGGMRPGERG